MLPFVSATEERSAIATVAAPKFSDDKERPFDMLGNTLARIHNVNTNPQRLRPSGRALGLAGARVEFGAAWERTARNDLLVMLTRRAAQNEHSWSVDRLWLTVCFRSRSAQMGLTYMAVALP